MAGEGVGRTTRRKDDDSFNLRTKNLRTLGDHRPTALPLLERSSLAGEEGGRSGRWCVRPRKDDDSSNLRTKQLARAGTAEATITAAMTNATIRTKSMRLISAISFLSLDATMSTVISSDESSMNRKSPGPSYSYPYSPECVEYEFSEVRARLKVVAS
jgi:hypothetical protein